MNTIKDVLYPSIPLDTGQIEGWKNIPIKEAGTSDPLVPLGPLSREANDLMTSSVYFGEHSTSPYAKDANRLDDSLLTIFTRRSVARRLLVAEQLLPPGYHLLIFDAYRPYQVQKALYDFYRQKLKEKHPNMDEEALAHETEKYVALPSQDPALPSQHSTGGAVDAVIVELDPEHENELLHIRSHLADQSLDFAKRIELETRLSALIKYAKMLDFGTPFDHGSEKAAPMYYESRLIAGDTLTDAEMQACNNRRLLHSVMTRAGFQPYFAEWWHFNAPEMQTGAASAGRSIASFGAIELDASNKSHEALRLKLRRATGDPDAGGDWPIEIIAPPEE